MKNFRNPMFKGEILSFQYKKTAIHFSFHMLRAPFKLGLLSNKQT